MRHHKGGFYVQARVAANRAQVRFRRLADTVSALEHRLRFYQINQIRQQSQICIG